MAKKTPTPDDRNEVLALLAEVRRDVRELIQLVQSRIEKRTT
jgi:hypothetical protein